MKKLLVIILLGPPGAGKGTQAILLAEKLDAFHFETSKIIEEKIMRAKKGDYLKVAGKKYDLLKEKELWKSGVLCSPPVVIFWVKEKIKELFKEGKGIVFSGSPRTLPEGKEEIPFLKKLYGKENIRVVLIKLSPEQTIFRNSHRRICQLARHPILYSKETLKLKNCPLDGSKLIKRKGLDEPETIKVRLKEYKERTLPLVDYFKKQGLKVKTVNGGQSVGAVFQDILDILKPLR